MYLDNMLPSYTRLSFKNADYHILISCSFWRKNTKSILQLPDLEPESVLFQIVTTCMMHGPCGSSNPNLPCMEDGKCTTHFPKDFRYTTEVNVNGLTVQTTRKKISSN